MVHADKTNIPGSPGIEEVGTRRELMVDDHLVEALTGGAALRLHHPSPREVVLTMDRPWEGNLSGVFHTVFRDGNRFRMYYKTGYAFDAATKKPGGRLGVGYAESADGIRWQRVSAGLVEFEGSRDNNLLFREGERDDVRGAEGFSPFRDDNPACDPAARYKAVGFPSVRKELMALGSPDGLRWRNLRPEPIRTDGHFDSQNLAFWDGVRGQYRVYYRGFLDGKRGIRTAVSDDFLNWSEGVWLDYPGAPIEELYTNQVLPYYRAPHLYLGFPARYVPRPWGPTVEALPELELRRLRAGLSERYGAALTETVFMSSRDGRTFRRWGEAFLRPGPQAVGNWRYADNYLNWGMIETPSDLAGAPVELSFFSSEGGWHDPIRFRRFTLRVDGFVSLNAPLAGGGFTSKLMRVRGDRLSLNVSTSAAGGARVELQTPDGRPLPGFALDDCHEIVGDTLNYAVRWKNNPSLAPALAAGPVRLRVELRDADLFSWQFQI
jgi:hypothetical protein